MRLYTWNVSRGMIHPKWAQRKKFINHSEQALNKSGGPSVMSLGWLKNHKRILNMQCRIYLLVGNIKDMVWPCGFQVAGECRDVPSTWCLLKDHPDSLLCHTIRNSSRHCWAGPEQKKVLPDVFTHALFWCIPYLTPSPSFPLRLGKQLGRWWAGARCEAHLTVLCLPSLQLENLHGDVSRPAVDCR